MANENPVAFPDRDRLKELARRANAGDSAAKVDLQAFLDQHPQVWQKLGDLSSHVRQTAIRRIANGEHLSEVSIGRNVEFLRQDLAGPNPSRVEQIAVDVAVNAWLDLHAIHLKYAADAGNNLPTAKYAILLRNSAQKRYDFAMKLLLLIREKMPAIDEANRKHLRKEGKLVPFPDAAVSGGA